MFFLLENFFLILYLVLMMASITFVLTQRNQVLGMDLLFTFRVRRNKVTLKDNAVCLNLADPATFLALNSSLDLIIL